MFLFNRKKRYYMNVKDADSTLKNILSACDMPPHSTPVDKLLLRQKASSTPYEICMLITLLQIIILLLFPFAWLLT